MDAESAEASGLADAESAEASGLTDAESEDKMLSDGSAELEDSDVDAELYFGEDECNETYYDDIVFDDYDNMQAHFDHMELPPGVEASVPWLVDSSKNDTEVPKASTSQYAGW